MKNYKNYTYIKHYGEYTIEYWLKLLLNADIVLPPYQRKYVWTLNTLIDLVKSFRDGLFVPPITIGCYYDENNNKKNYIIDGQQRLTSLLLFYYGIFPIEKNSKKIIIYNENEIDDIEFEDDVDTEENEQIIEFDQKLLINSIQELYKNYKNANTEKFVAVLLRNGLFKKIEDIASSEYDNNFFDKKHLSLYLEMHPDDEIFKNSFLGFSYIKPNEDINGFKNYKEQRKYFVSIFRNINGNSKVLTDIERRKSLYWISGEEKLFTPEFIYNYKTHNNNDIDFARLLAFVSEYYVAYNSGNKKIKKYYFGKGLRSQNQFDEYINDFVLGFIDKDNINTNRKFNFDIFKDNIPALKIAIELIHPNIEFKNYIEIDMYFFGLIFWLLFCKCEFKKDIICIKEKIDNYIIDQISSKQNNNYNRIGSIRERMEKSINIYKEIFLNENALF